MCWRVGSAAARSATPVPRSQALRRRWHAGRGQPGRLGSGRCSRLAREAASDTASARGFRPASGVNWPVCTPPSWSPSFARFCCWSHQSSHQRHPPSQSQTRGRDAQIMAQSARSLERVSTYVILPLQSPVPGLTSWPNHLSSLPLWIFLTALVAKSLSASIQLVFRENCSPYGCVRWGRCVPRPPAPACWSSVLIKIRI